MKKVLPLLLFLIAASAFAQEADSQSPVPFVSKLRAKAHDSRILITWRNPESFQGSILLYRHSAEIDANNYQDAQLIARLNARQSSFEDNPAYDNPYFYAALIEDPNGTVQRLFIPFRNKTSSGVRIAVLPTAESLSTHITGISTEIFEDSVRVTFQSSSANRPLLLFRSTTPILGTEGLLEAFAPLQLDAGTNSFIDFPIAGVETYYAVIDSELFKLGKHRLEPGENTTEVAAVIPLDSEGAAAQSETASEPVQPAAQPAPRRSSSTQRSQAQSAPGGSGEIATVKRDQQPPAGTPLPYLQPAQSAGGGETLPRRKRLSDPRTQAAIDRVLASAPPLQPLRSTVTVLPEEKSAPAAGESGELNGIVAKYLLTGNFQEAEAKLQGFLNLKRSAYIEARARFYLAQSYYFQQLYEEALLEFVLAQEPLYVAVQPWLDSCFRRLYAGP